MIVNIQVTGANEHQTTLHLAPQRDSDVVEETRRLQTPIVPLGTSCIAPGLSVLLQS